MFQSRTMVYYFAPVTPSAYPQRSVLHMNNIETHAVKNDNNAPDKYQALLWDPQRVCLGFLLKQTL